MKYAEEIARLFGGKIEKVEDIDAAYKTLDARGGFDAKLVNKLIVNACKYIFELEKSDKAPETVGYSGFSVPSAQITDSLWPTFPDELPKELVKTVTKRKTPNKKNEKRRVQSAK